MRSLLAVLELALGRAASVVHDHVVHASDLCCGGDLAELEVAADWIARLPHRHKVIVAGNHDWAFVHEPARARMLFATAHYLKDAEVMIDGVRFYGSPWQPAFHDWAFNLPRGAALAAVWAKIPRGVDVLITHGPPNGIGDRTTMVARAGCVDLRRRVAELAPALHLFGHIHQDGGAWRHGATTFANVTTWECERSPTMFDLEGGVVTPTLTSTRPRQVAPVNGARPPAKHRLFVLGAPVMVNFMCAEGAIVIRQYPPAPGTAHLQRPNP